MQAPATDESNSDKLNLLDGKVNRILVIIEGTGEDSPGLVARISLVERLLWGKDHQDGIVQKVTVLWKLHVWVLCTLSGLAGFALREAVRLVWKV